MRDGIRNAVSLTHSLRNMTVHRKMRKSAICLGGGMLLLASAVFAQSLFDKGANAYKRGDYETSLAVFRPLAESGDAKAQSILGLMYSYGEGVSVDYRESARWYKRAADQNSSVAQYNLGMLYAEGKGVQQDTDLAIDWLTKAAERGHFRARTELARLDAGAYSSLDSASSESLVTPPTVGAEPERRSVVMTNRKPERTTPATTSPTAKVVVASAAASPPPEPANNHTKVEKQAKTNPPAPAATTAPAASRPATANNGAYRVQLAASRSEEYIRRDWSSYQQRYSDIFGDLDASVERAEIGDEKTVWYRLRVGPFASESSAKELCQKLSERGIKTGCLPLRVAN
jgi:TPR repeat protein